MFKRIIVKEAAIQRPNLTIETKPLSAALLNSSQLVAVARAVNSEASITLDLLNTKFSSAFYVTRDKHSPAWFVWTVPGSRFSFSNIYITIK